MVEGPTRRFVDWAFDSHGEHQTGFHHILANYTIDIDSDTAHSEAYLIIWGDNRDRPANLNFGRYIDRM